TLLRPSPSTNSLGVEDRYPRFLANCSHRENRVGASLYKSDLGFDSQEMLWNIKTGSGNPISLWRLKRSSSCALTPSQYKDRFRRDQSANKSSDVVASAALSHQRVKVAENSA